MTTMTMTTDLARKNNLTSGTGDTRGWAFMVWGIPFLLSVCGVIMIMSLSQRNSSGVGPLYAMPLRQLIYLALGTVIMFIVSTMDLRFLRGISVPMWGISLLLLYITAIPSIGIARGGARRWLSLGFIQFQPLEFLLFALPIVMADRLNAYDPKTRKGFFGTFVKPTGTIILFSCLPMLSQHLGGLLLVASICLLMHIERRGWKYPLWACFLLALGFIILIRFMPYRARRFESYMDPWSDPRGKGYQIIQGLIAFANGSLYGLGIGKGLQGASYLPAAQTDYILAAFGEEFGLIGTLSLLSLYALWTWLMYKSYKGLRDPFLSSLTVGMTASVICPMFINLAGVTHLLPLTGIPMPFLSMGGSAMIFMWAKVGVLVKLSSYSVGFGPLALPPSSGFELPSTSSSSGTGYHVNRTNRVTLENLTDTRIRRRSAHRPERSNNIGLGPLPLPPSSRSEPLGKDYHANQTNRANRAPRDNRTDVRPERRHGHRPGHRQ